MGHAHPKHPKKYASKGSYKRFLAYIHMRSPGGKKAKGKQTISGRTPRSHKERVVYIAGKKHEPNVS
jgi:hypothetical protein